MVLDWRLNPGPPALKAGTIPLGYRGGGCVLVMIPLFIYKNNTTKHNNNAVDDDDAYGDHGNDDTEDDDGGCDEVLCVQWLCCRIIKC